MQTHKALTEKAQQEAWLIRYLNAHSFFSIDEFMFENQSQTYYLLYTTDTL
jgi:hypothetical protein